MRWKCKQANHAINLLLWPRWRGQNIVFFFVFDYNLQNWKCMFIFAGSIFKIDFKFLFRIRNWHANTSDKYFHFMYIVYTTWNRIDFLWCAYIRFRDDDTPCLSIIFSWIIHSMAIIFKITTCRWWRVLFI